MKAFFAWGSKRRAWFAGVAAAFRRESYVQLQVSWI